MNRECNKKQGGDLFRGIKDELNTLELPVTQDEFDDLLLPSHIKNVLFGKDFLDPDGMSKKETATLVTKIIARQMRSGNPSKVAVAFVAVGFDRYLNGESELFENSFFPCEKRKAGGQVKQEALELAVCAAYHSVMYSNEWPMDDDGKTRAYSMTDHVLNAAENAAIDEYYRFKNKPIDEIFEREKRFTQTVRPILKKYDIYVKKTK